MDDTIATYEVFKAQLEKYDDLKNDVDFLSKYSEVRGKCVDVAGFIRYNNEKKEDKPFNCKMGCHSHRRHKES